jgi:hypothetical protein
MKAHRIKCINRWLGGAWFITGKPLKSQGRKEQAQKNRALINNALFLF